jgi:hypothetical protein
MKKQHKQALIGLAVSAAGFVASYLLENMATPHRITAEGILLRAAMAPACMCVGFTLGIVLGFIVKVTRTIYVKWETHCLRRRREEERREKRRWEAMAQYGQAIPTSPAGQPNGQPGYAEATSYRPDPLRFGVDPPKQSRFNLGKLVVIGLCVAYILYPGDFIPDFIPVIGYGDDLMAAFVGVKQLL